MKIEAKVEKFIKENKGKIIVGGIIIGAVMYNNEITKTRIAKKYFVKGTYAGFQSSITWFDKNFNDLHLRELWNEWAIANPDRVVKY